MLGKLNIGVDVGGTNIKFGIVSASGKILLKSSVCTNPVGGGKEILTTITNNVKQIIKNAGLSLNDVNSVGIGFPGTVDHKKGMVVYAPNIYWKDVAVTRSVKQNIRKDIFIAQDSRAAAWGEFLVGSGVGYSDIVSITLGTGIGCGMIINGNIYNGGLNTAGEFGHQVIRENDNPCTCGRKGCLETLIGAPAIIKSALKSKTLAKKIGLKDRPVSVSDIYGLAAEGDKEAIEVTGKVVEYLAAGLVNMINIVSPQVICISGGISNAKDKLLLTPLRKAIQHNVYKPVARKVKIVKSVLGSDAPLVGAALLYKNQF
ncbi:MAG TPA: ROK family protein [Niabella sp.]|nr:ROK family protein [Niabella sp.]